MRRSLRARTLLVLTLVAFAPLALVWLSDLGDRTVGRRMAANLRAAATEAAEIVAEGGDDASRRLDEVAWRHVVRLRVLDAEGQVLHDLDRERGDALAWRVGSLFFSPDGTPSLRAWDDAEPPLGRRPVVARIRAEGAASGCGQTEGHRLLVCHAGRLVGTPGGARVVIAHESSRRAIRSLYDVRYQLIKLSLFVAPVALMLGLWLGHRWFRPIAQLREQALQRSHAPLRAAPIALDSDDEFGDLAQAFNTLLAAVNSRARANEAFVADLAHELKNPVAAVRAVAERMAEPVDPARAERLARVLLDSSQRLDAVVSRFLELARAEAGLTDEERVSFDLTALATGLADSLSRDDRTPIRVAVHGPPVLVRAVPGRVETALRNLLENAASFARSQVTVTVRAGDDAEVEVTDDGPGIAPDDLPRVFERFFTTRGDQRGTGLGLALARAVAEAHGGRVEARSDPGCGATFTLTLPLKA